MTKIAIIGAGVVGGVIAYELSRVPGLSITLLDRHGAASGATGAALGVLMGAISMKKNGRAWALRHTSTKRYKTLIPELEGITKVNIPYTKGILKLLFPEDNLVKWKQLAEMRRSQGYQLEIWQPDHVKQHYPYIHINNIIGAVYSPGDGQVNPTILTQALIAGAQINGVDCQFGVNVENIILNSDKIQLETTADSLNVDWLVIAAGLGSTPLTACLKETIAIGPVLGQGLELKLEQGLGDGQPVISGHDVHIIPLPEGSYWVGATVEFPQEKSKLVPVPEMLEEVKRKAIACCPNLAHGTIVRTWWGLRPRPQGRFAPIIEKLPGYDRVLLATGHYRNGILLAPATAIAIRNLLLSETKDWACPPDHYTPTQGL